jgi:D-3-phosphoglycerate dehydrogenase
MIDVDYLAKFEKPIFFYWGHEAVLYKYPQCLALIPVPLSEQHSMLPVEKFPKLAEQNWYADLIRRDNVILSPHVAGWTFESYYKLSEVAADKIIAFLTS